MSPASKSKSKSKVKSSTMAAKEQKSAPKSSVPTNATTNGSSGSVYNPTSGSFHLLETTPAASSPPSHSNGRFQNIDDSDDHSSSPRGTVSEYDSVSNNGSCSGESEDLKDKATNTAPHRESLSAADSERREKIRLKNEKKHQRQRERRAQELHEKCCGYLMSRKLEALSQQLVNMGFSSERATLALILNEGRVEDSVSWLLSEEDVQSKDSNLGNRGALKLDITEELGQVTELESKYKCSKLEVERAIVACEGDLVMAEKSLRAQKQDTLATPSKQEAASDPKNSNRLQEKPTTASVMVPQRGSTERDFNYTRTATSSDPNMGLNPNQQVRSGDRRWLDSESSPSFPSTVGMQQASSLKIKSEVFHGISEDKFNQPTAVRESVIMMQHPQAAFSRQIPASALNLSPPSVSTGFYPRDSMLSSEVSSSNMKLLHSQRLGGLGQQNQAREPLYHQFKESSAVDPFNYVFDMGSGRSYGARNVIPEAHGSWNPLMGGGAASPSIAAPPSLGLFSCWGSSGSSFGSNSHVDWQTGGLVPEFDYTSIDWTLDSSLLAASKGNGLWLGVSSLLRDRQASMMFDRDSRVRFGDQTAPSGGSREWTSPFAGKDIFSLPRQFVTSPSP